MSEQSLTRSPPDTLERDDGGPEVLISNVLRLGVLLSLALVTAGMSLTFLHHPDYFSSSQSLSHLTSPEHCPHAVSEVFGDVMSARGQAFVMAGLLVLMATPVMRVALSLLVFGRQRDRAYVMVTAVVLTLLLWSFVRGAGE